MLQCRIGLAVLVFVAVPCQADPATDQAVTGRTAEEMIGASKQVFAVQKPQRQSCAQTDPTEIVVCVDRGRDQRMASPIRSDPNSRSARRALDGNIPSAPDVSSIECRRGADGVCRGNFGQVPEPAYYIDVSALPQAPDGSDADRIAKGEMPPP